MANHRTDTKGDTVKVIAGKDVGHQGRVVHVDPRKGKVLVEGAGRARKHTRTGSKRSTGVNRKQLEEMRKQLRELHKERNRDKDDEAK